MFSSSATVANLWSAPAASDDRARLTSPSAASSARSVSFTQFQSRPRRFWCPVMPTITLPFMAHRNMRDLRSCGVSSPDRGFSQALTLRYGRARPGINPEIFSFRVSLRDPPETNRILGDPVAFPPGLLFRVFEKTLKRKERPP